MEDYVSFLADITLELDTWDSRASAYLEGDSPNEEFDIREEWRSLKRRLARLMRKAEEMLDGYDLAKLKHEFGKWHIRRDQQFHTQHGIRTKRALLELRSKIDQGPQKIGEDKWGLYQWNAFGQVGREV
jgi:hypothetical protein